MTQQLIIKTDEKSIQKTLAEGGDLQFVVDQTKQMIEEYVATDDYNAATKKGRDSIKSFAVKIRKVKSTVDGFGKDYVATLKERTKSIDSARKSMRDQLEVLWEETRKPLTEYEDQIKALELDLKNTSSRIAELSSPADLITQQPYTIDELKANQAEIESIAVNPEFTDKQKENLNNSIERGKMTVSALIAAEQTKLDQIEAERKAEEERQAQAQKEREQQIAKEAAEQAKKEAEERALKAEQDKQAAIEREEKLKQQATEAEKQRKIEAEQAKKREAQAAEDARQAEIKRQAEQESREKLEQERREANMRHIGAIRKQSKDDLMKLGLDEGTAKKIVLSIAKGEIRNMQINY